jgi:hypothetical protein
MIGLSALILTDSIVRVDVSRVSAFLRSIFCVVVVAVVPVSGTSTVLLCCRAWFEANEIVMRFEGVYGACRNFNEKEAEVFLLLSVFLDPGYRM